MDTSVLRGEHVNGKYQSYDYRRVPNLTSYPIGDSLTLVDGRGDMREYPISTEVVSSVAYLINKHLTPEPSVPTNISSARFGDGVSIGVAGGRWGRVRHKVGQLLGTKCLRASVEGPKNLDRVLAYTRRHRVGDDFVIIGHPKNLSPKSIHLFEQFIVNHQELDFMTF